MICELPSNKSQYLHVILFVIETDRLNTNWGLDLYAFRGDKKT